MNRDSLFRGKRMDNKEWIEGSLILMGPTNYAHCFILPTYASSIYDIIEVYFDTIGQDTGLTDKNGEKIFEGDIVHIHDLIFKYGDPNHEFNGYVDFANGSFVILGINEVVHYRWLDYDITVIGNIHDDPELLGGM